MTMMTDIRVRISRDFETTWFEDSVTGACVDVYEYHDTRMGLKTYAINSVMVPPLDRGRGVGGALMRRVLQHYDDEGMALRLVVAGCCMPTQATTIGEKEEMHAWGHVSDCDQRDERLSHHDLQRWYRSYGFIDRTDCDSWTSECGCSYSLYRPVPNG